MSNRSETNSSFCLEDVRYGDDFTSSENASNEFERCSSNGTDERFADTKDLESFLQLRFNQGCVPSKLLNVANSPNFSATSESTLSRKCQAIKGFVKHVKRMQSKSKPSLIGIFR